MNIDQISIRGQISHLTIFWVGPNFNFLNKVHFWANFIFGQISFLTKFHFCPNFIFVQISFLPKFHFCPNFIFDQISFLTKFHFWPNFIFAQILILTNFRLLLIFDFYHFLLADLFVFFWQIFFEKIDKFIQLFSLWKQNQKKINSKKEWNSHGVLTYSGH